MVSTGLSGLCVAGVVLAAAQSAASAPARVKLIEDFEGPVVAGWQAVDAPAVGNHAGATGQIFSSWSASPLKVDGVPTGADGLAFWVRTDDANSAAITVGLFEERDGRQSEAWGVHLWATPTWRRLVVPLSGLKRIWAAKADDKLDRDRVKAVLFRRLIWEGGLRSRRIVLDDIEFVKGAERPAFQRKDDERRVGVDAARPGPTLRRFWRAICPADTVAQNSYFQGPDGQAMRTIAADRTFDYARVGWHVKPSINPWLKYKYGSPIYDEDASGKAVYRFADMDALVDNIVQCRLRPMMLLCGMPRALAADANAQTYGGCVCPPKDYDKWRSLVRTFVAHYADKYGREEVARWYWEIWNEPDLWWLEWKCGGKDAGREAYLRLYDHAAAAIVDVLGDSARIGGPAIAGWPRDYGKLLASHCVSGHNDATGGTGAPLGFLSHHGYSDPFGHLLKLYEAKVVLGVAAGGRGVEVVVSEYGCGIWGPPYGTRYQAASLCQAIDAFDYAGRVDGVELAWLYWFGTLRAFSGSNDAYFVPPDAKAKHQITTLFLHVRDTLLAKPVYNAYRMLNHLAGRRLNVSGAYLGEKVHAMATLGEDGRRVAVLLYSHDPADLDSTGPAETVNLEVRGLPFAGRVRVEQYAIDPAHSDIYAAWQAEGAPAHGRITPEQVARIKAHDALEPAAKPQTATVDKTGAWSTPLKLPANSLALFVLTAE